LRRQRSELISLLGIPLPAALTPTRDPHDKRQHRQPEDATPHAAGAGENREPADAAVRPPRVTCGLVHRHARFARERDDEWFARGDTRRDAAWHVETISLANIVDERCR
jgi:hypothetical protein